MVDTVKWVAARLGNTPAVCKKSYIHPAVLELHLAEAAQASDRASPEARALAHELQADEAELMRLLETLTPPRADAVVVTAESSEP